MNTILIFVDPSSTDMTRIATALDDGKGLHTRQQAPRPLRTGRFKFCIPAENLLAASYCCESHETHRLERNQEQKKERKKEGKKESHSSKV